MLCNDLWNLRQLRALRLSEVVMHTLQLVNNNLPFLRSTDQREMKWLQVHRDCTCNSQHQPNDLTQVNKNSQAQDKNEVHLLVRVGCLLQHRLIALAHRKQTLMLLTLIQRFLPTCHGTFNNSKGVVRIGHPVEKKKTIWCKLNNHWKVKYYSDDS